MGIYSFKEEDAVRFAQEHGGRFRRRGVELVLQKCPYCHADDKDTFSISLLTGQFECKRGSCRAKGNMITLSRDFNFSLGRDADTFFNTTDFSRRQYREFAEAHKAPTDPAIRYLQSRGISKAICEKYEITTKKDKDNVLVFPFRDEEGTLRFIKYRDTEHTKESKTPKEWCEKNCKPVLFGMNHCSGTGTLTITEGQIDSLSLAEAGIENAVSVPNGKNGFTWVPYCYNFVNQYEKIVIFGDLENGTVSLADEIKKRWELKTRVVRPEDYKGCKDANEILHNYGPEALRQAVENAAPPNMDCIKALAAVKYVDIMRMPMIKSNMKEVDEVLDGGFRLGELAILTGKRGQGKSTLASQWVVEAIEQDINCFCYSGELPDFYFRNWIDRQVTGKSEVQNSDIDKLNQYYGEKVFLYDSTGIEDERKDLTAAVELAIVQKECKFILLDNLMTALDADQSDDLYRAQSRLVGKLAALAKKYTVFILLIAHPRKSNGQIGNDDVSGSSNITDRADLVFTYGEIEGDANEDARKLEILKNRLTGKLARDKKGIRLVFDGASKRVATNTGEMLLKRYSWTNDGFYNLATGEREKIPF